MKRENKDRRDKDRRDHGRRDHDEGGRDRNRDRRHERSRRDRDHDRSQTSGESVTGTSLDIHGPVVLLKRPDSSLPSASSNSSSASRESGNKLHESHHQRDSQSSQGPGKPTAILLRSGQWKRGSVTDVRGSTSSPGPSEAGSGDAKLAKPKAPVQPGLMKAKYKFPSEHAIPILNASKDATVEMNLPFVSANSNVTDFFVITALGVPHAGKSSVLSYLGSKNQEFTQKQLFLPRQPHERKEGFVYMTGSNEILIELPSVFNGAAVNDMMTLMGREGTLENAAMSWNLRMVIWALSVSHLVVVVSEDLIAPNLLQLINTASMIHPAESVFGEDAFSELIYVCNRAEDSLIKNKKASEAAQSIFASVLGKQARISQNFFVLPHTKWKSHEREFQNFKIRVDDFIRYNRATLAPEVAGVKKFPQNLTLADWLHASKRVWEDVAQHSSFHSYMKLLP